MSYPTYQKLATNGNGLALTLLRVRNLSGSSWVSRTNYSSGQKYRLQMRFTNFYINALTYGGGPYHIEIDHLHYQIILPPATFYNSQSYSGTAHNGIYSNTPDLNYELTAEQSIYYYAYFVWNAGTTRIDSFPISISFSGRELVSLPNIPSAMLYPA